MRKLQRYVVNIPRRTHDLLKAHGEIQEGIILEYLDTGVRRALSPSLGFLGEDHRYTDPNDLVC